LLSTQINLKQADGEEESEGEAKVLHGIVRTICGQYFP